MKYDRIIKFLSLAVLAGCSREAELPEEGNLEWVSLQLEGGPSSRVAIDGSTGLASLTTGDQVAVHTSAGSYTTCTVDVENSRVAVPLGAGASRDGYAVYPASAAANNSTSAVQVIYPDTYDLSGYGDAALAALVEAPCPMVAVNTPGQSLVFRQVGGLLRIRLEKVETSTKSISVTVAGPPITGTATVTNPGTSLSTSSIASGGHVVTFILPSSYSDMGYHTIILNIPVPMGTYTACRCDIKNDKDYIYGRYSIIGSSTIARATGNQLNRDFTVTDPVHPFSISADKQVAIAPGNLQFIKSKPKISFKFAEQPWDYLGTTTGQDSDDSEVDRDLFGWATSGWTRHYAYLTTTTDTDYGPAISSGEWTSNSRYWDWGQQNIIYNFGTSKTWRTLTSTEWAYLFARVDANSLALWTHATVAGVPGIILFPDDFIDTNNAFPVTGSSSTESSYIIDESDWVIWAYEGCAFLPEAGRRNGTEVSDVGSHGYYWSSTTYGSGFAFALTFHDSGICSVESRKRHEGSSVRLVRELN